MTSGRRCGCGVDLSGRHGSAVYCRPCAVARKRARELERTRRNRKPREPKLCVDCKADISHRGNRTHRCTDCAAKRLAVAARLPKRIARRKAAYTKNRAAIRAASLASKRQNPRACLGCGADITLTHINRRRCEPCYKEHRRAYHKAKHATPEYIATRAAYKARKKASA